jgi:hypothetical protein
MDKQQLLFRLMRERDKFELLINRVGHLRKLTTRGVKAGMSIKDILAHIFAHEQYMADRMAELMHGDEYIPSKNHLALHAFAEGCGYPDFGSSLISDEEANAWVDEKYKNAPLEDIITQEMQAFMQIHSAIEKMAEENFNKHNIAERVADNTYRHYQEHAKEIRRWLNEIKSRN